MAASEAENTPLAGQGSGAIAFLLLFDPPHRPEVAAGYDGLTSALARDCERVLGLSPPVTWLGLPPLVYRQGLSDAELEAHGAALQERVSGLAGGGPASVFVLPASLDFGLAYKQWLTESVRRLQRSHPQVTVHYDAVNPAHPLLVQALCDRALAALQRAEVRSPAELGLLLVASGSGDADTRADAYRVMRLVWEQLGLSRGDVAFVRHTALPMPEQLRRCSETGRPWLCLPQFLFPSETHEYARLLFADGAGQYGSRSLFLADSLTDHPHVQAWLAQRMLALQRSHRDRRALREASPKHRAAAPACLHGPGGRRTPLASLAGSRQEQRGFAGAAIAEVSDRDGLGTLLGWFGVPTERVLIKPTWHGYATGTYTDPVALDLLLGAIGRPSVLVEGHTSSRNRAGDRLDPTWDWEDGRAQRTFIRAEEQAYLARTGLLDCMRSHRARYVNVTEAHWDDQCAPAEAVLALLEEENLTLHHPELAGYVPKALFDQRGATLISFARFKGPTRLATANLFGLLPPPLRTAWHGPNITYFARVCCDLAKLYGTLFSLYGLVESLNVAVRWDRQGLYRSRWGNYDLVPTPGLVCLGQGVAAADVLAARLQGQDVTRSAFFDVVQTELGYDRSLADAPIADDLVARFV